MIFCLIIIFGVWGWGSTFFSLCPYRGCVGERVELLTNIFKVIEEEHANHPEEDQGDEDYND